MNHSQRTRIQEQAQELAHELAPNITIHVIWCRWLPDAHAYAYCGARAGAASFGWILICETSWAHSSESERADTIAHEVAHVLTWHDSPTDHGPEWKKVFKRLLKVALEFDWC